MRTLVFNGWAAGPETWALCTFPHDWVFNYLEQLDGLPEKVMEEVDEVVLVGFSMGGATALRMLLRYPEKVKGLVLVSATPCMMERGKREEGTGNGEQGTGNGEERGNRERGTGNGEQEWKGMSLRRRAALKLGTQIVFRNDPSPLYEERNLDRGLDYLQNTDLRTELQSFSRQFPVPRSLFPLSSPFPLPRSLFPVPSLFPVHILQSERDGIVRPSNAAFLKSVFPQATVTMVPGSEHVLPITRPELIDAAVAAVTGERSANDE